MIVVLTILVIASIAIMIEAHTKLDALRYRLASLEDKLKR